MTIARWRCFSWTHDVGEKHCRCTQRSRACPSIRSMISPTPSAAMALAIPENVGKCCSPRRSWSELSLGFLEAIWQTCLGIHRTLGCEASQVVSKRSEDQPPQVEGEFFLRSNMAAEPRIKNLSPSLPSMKTTKPILRNAPERLNTFALSMHVSQKIPRPSTIKMSNQRCDERRQFATVSGLLRLVLGL